METETGVGRAVEDQRRAAVAQGQGGELAVEAVAQLAGGGLGQGHVLFAADHQAAAGHSGTDHPLQYHNAGEHAGAGVDHVEGPGVPGADGGADAHGAGRFQVKFIFPVVLGNAGADNDIQVFGAVAGHGQRLPGGLMPRSTAYSPTATRRSWMPVMRSRSQRGRRRQEASSSSMVRTFSGRWTPRLSMRILPDEMASAADGEGRVVHGSPAGGTREAIPWRNVSIGR